MSVRDRTVRAGGRKTEINRKIPHMCCHSINTKPFERIDLLLNTAHAALQQRQPDRHGAELMQMKMEKDLRKHLRDQDQPQTWTVIQGFVFTSKKQEQVLEHSVQIDIFIRCNGTVRVIIRRYIEKMCRRYSTSCGECWE